VLPGGPTFVNPYSVRATKAMGTVEMMTPAMGMKPQMKTKVDSRPTPGIFRAHMPRQVRMVLTAAMRACRGTAGTAGEAGRQAGRP
jgi:hypothetical protein